MIKANNFEGGELTIYIKSGDQISIDLSPMQILTCFRILGFEIIHGNSYTCYSDNTLKELFAFKGNPLKLTKKEEVDIC